jgi:hypothetical protein
MAKRRNLKKEKALRNQAGLIPLALADDGLAGVKIVPRILTTNKLKVARLTQIQERLHPKFYLLFSSSA